MPVIVAIAATPATNTTSGYVAMVAVKNFLVLTITLLKVRLPSPLAVFDVFVLSQLCE